MEPMNRVYSFGIAQAISPWEWLCHKFADVGVAFRAVDVAVLEFGVEGADRYRGAGHDSHDSVDRRVALERLARTALADALAGAVDLPPAMPFLLLAVVHLSWAQELASMDLRDPRGTFVAALGYAEGGMRFFNTAGKALRWDETRDLALALLAAGRQSPEV